MTARPILFNGEMVRAILDGRKTQTRRPVKPQPYTTHPIHESPVYRNKTDTADCLLNRDQCPFGEPGDRLWVRETWEPFCEGRVLYRADGEDQKNNVNGTSHCWRPSIHMPRWASRIMLEVTGVRVERIQSISGIDAQNEGICAVVPDGDVD
jgi:hypothetical protein